MQVQYQFDSQVDVSSKVCVTIDKPTHYDLELDNDLQKLCYLWSFIITVVVP